MVAIAVKHSNNDLLVPPVGTVTATAIVGGVVRRIIVTTVASSVTTSVSTGSAATGSVAATTHSGARSLTIIPGAEAAEATFGTSAATAAGSSSATAAGVSRFREHALQPSRQFLISLDQQRYQIARQIVVLVVEKRSRETCGSV